MLPNFTLTQTNNKFFIQLGKNSFAMQKYLEIWLKQSNLGTATINVYEFLTQLDEPEIPIYSIDLTLGLTTYSASSFQAGMSGKLGFLYAENNGQSAEIATYGYVIELVNAGATTEVEATMTNLSGGENRAIIRDKDFQPVVF